MILNAFINKNEEQNVHLGKLTVLIGPNNCGKSQTMKDIASLMSDGSPKPKIVSGLDYTPAEYSNIKSLINVTDHPTTLDYKRIVGLGKDFAEIEINVTNQDFENAKDRGVGLNSYNRFRVVLLNAQNRLSMLQETGTEGIKNERASNLLQLTYLDYKEQIIKEFQEIFQKTFKNSIYLDYTGLSQICLRISQTEINSLTNNPQKDRGVLKELEKIDDQGEGYKSFAATVLGLICAKNRLVLLDEPEISLHNAQQRQLGQWIGNFIKNNDTQLVIATHSSNFLEGLLSSESGLSINIQRLNRIENNTTFNNIEPSIVKQFTIDPILSSQRVLDAIFQKAVVVCEADADRMIYKIVADKIDQSHEILFIHSHNKQTTPKIVKTLKECAVPVYSILDIDVFHEDKEYNEILKAHGIDFSKDPKCASTQNEVKQFINNYKNDADIRTNLRIKLEEISSDCGSDTDITILKQKVGKLNKIFSNWHKFKKQGENFITVLEIKTKLIALINKLKKDNLYIVPGGELESWLPESHTKGKKWINYAVEEINKKTPSNLNGFINEIIEKVN